MTRSIKHGQLTREREGGGPSRLDADGSAGATGRRVRVVGIRDRSLMAMHNPPDLSRSGSLGISRRTVTSEDHHHEVARMVDIEQRLSKLIL